MRDQKSVANDEVEGIGPIGLTIYSASNKTVRRRKCGRNLYKYKATEKKKAILRLEGEEVIYRF